MKKISLVAILAVLFITGSVSAGLVAHWPMDDNAANQTVVNTVGPDATYVTANTDARTTPAPVGTGLNFTSGAGDHVDAGNDTSLDLGTNWTISARIRPDTASRQWILGKMPNAPGGGSYGMFLEGGTGQIVFGGTYVAGAWGDQAISTGGVPMGTGAWSHVAMTHDGTYVRFYIDGVLDSTANSPGSLQTDTNNVVMGWETSWNSQRLDGGLDDVAIWNHTLSDAAVRSVFDNGVPAPDDDGDGVADWEDLCENTPLGTQVNADGCPDADGDGVADADDNCSGTPPGTWIDEYGCAIPDTDGDGVYDPCDACPGTPGSTQVNAEGCPDADGDGVADTDDLCPGTPPGGQVGADGCVDTDGDGVPDIDDQCPGTAPSTPVDGDGCPLSTEFISVMAVSATLWGDVNNDGFSDMAGGSNLYINQQDGTFAVTQPFSITQGSLSDWDNDGLLDAFSFAAGAPPQTYYNNGDETFTHDNSMFISAPGAPAYSEFPLNSNGNTPVDLNGDGFLDVYCSGWWNSDVTSLDHIWTSYYDGVSDPCWSHTWSFGPPWQHKGVTPCDFDEDGDQDLFVAGYWYDASSLWRNDGFNGFTGLTEVGVAYGTTNPVAHSQSGSWADFDNDGHFDLFMANFAHPGNTSARFLESQGEPGFHFNNRGLCGVVQVEPLSGGIAGDYDNDGYVDLIVTTSGGYGAIYNRLYRNNGDWTFSEVTSETGLAGLGPDDMAAWGDYNNEGYLDLIAAGQLWRNPGGPNHWLKVKLLGGPHANGLVNGSAIGAQVRISVPGLGTLVRQVEGNTGQIGSQNDQVLHFGLGSYSGTVDLDIAWPNGYQETIYGVGIDQGEPLVIQLGDPRDVISMGYRLDGDFDGSCDVTVDDLWVLAALWLADCGVVDCSAVDTDSSATVDLDDFGAFSDKWGTCNGPGVEGCISNW